METTNIQNRGRNQFKKVKGLLNGLSSLLMVFPQMTRIKWLEGRRYTRGKIGIGIRYVLLKSIAKDCGDNVVVFEGVFFGNPQNISFGNNISIHPMSYIECGYLSPGVSIGDDVSIAHGVTIMATAHDYENHEGNIRDFQVHTKPVTIRNNVWIAAKATITAGITIAEGCVIGANAVVTKDTEVDGVYVGVPARKIKTRSHTG